MPIALFEEQPEENRRTVDDILGPLKEGRPVVMTVTDSRLPKKKRIGDAPVLMMVPSEMFGGRGKLVVALQGYGCEILDLPNGLKPLTLARLGLSMFLSQSLAGTLNRFYGGKDERKTSTGRA